MKIRIIMTSVFWVTLDIIGRNSQQIEEPKKKSKEYVRLMNILFKDANTIRSIIEKKENRMFFSYQIKLPKFI